METNTEATTTTAELDQAIATEIVELVIQWAASDDWAHFPQSVSELQDHVDANMVLFEVADDFGLVVDAFSETGHNTLNRIAAVVDIMLAATAADIS